MQWEPRRIVISLPVSFSSFKGEGSIWATNLSTLSYLITDRLHSENPDMDVRCISDSGSLYPFQDHTDFCYPQLLEYAAFEAITKQIFESGMKIILSSADLGRNLWWVLCRGRSHRAHLHQVKETYDCIYGVWEFLNHAFWICVDICNWIFKCGHCL